jgi:gliding motility-associated-like protein
MHLFKKIILNLIAVFASIGMTEAQTPMEIKVLPGGGNGQVRGCSDQYAGTWRRGSFIGRSNDINNQTMFFCMGDQLQLLGNNDADLTGDPQVSTRPGVGYAFYSCPPTISGPDIATIVTDPCVATAPPPAPPPTFGIYVDAQDGGYNGDRLFSNTGALQNFFNNGLPVSLWFAPITLDDFDARGYESLGPCVNSNIFVSFNIVYLNQIEISDFTANGANPLEGSVRISGGLPQWATTGSERFYNNIIIELVTNPTIRGTITNGTNFAHQDVVNFVVPQPGNYRIRVTDSKACPGELIVTLPQNDVEIVLGQAEVSPGQTVCVPITVNNFNNVIGFQFAITWDPTIIRFNQYNLPNPPPIDNMVVNANGPNGEFRVIWDNPNAVSLPDGTVLFELCFEAIGNPGDSSYLTITNRPIPYEIIANDVVANTNIVGGGIKIRIPVNLTVYGRSCSTTGASGSITFSAVGGTGPYSYILEKSDASITRMGVINNPGDWITEMNLTPGSYNIDVRDANNTLVLFTINVHNSAPLFISLNTINPRCYEESNGRVEINSVGGGRMPYTFKWSIGQFGGNDIRQLPAGNYGVTVIDDYGCTASASTTLGVTQVTATFNINRPSCSGKRDGSIQALPAGGTPGSPPYRYLWSDFSTGQTLSNVGPGCYRVTITDGNNCSFEDQVCLDPVKTLDIDITSTRPTCHEDTDGSISARAFQNGGTDFPPYVFQWSEGTVTNSPPDQSTISNLAGDRNYALTVTDQDGCSITRVIELNERPPVSLFLIDKKEVSCGGNGMDGEIQVVGSGGTFIYNYIWNTGATTGSITNLTPGMYSVTVTDSNGCSVSATYEIELQGPDLTMAATPVTCPGGTDGSANVTFSFPGSTQIRWSNGSSSNTISNLTSGWYYVTVTANINGVDCDQLDSVFVSQPDPLTVVENLTAPTCPGGTDGIIELIVSGGTGTYTFQWAHSPLTTNRLLNQRGGQTYTVTIRDGSSCPPLVYSFTMPTREFIRFRFSQLTGVSCPTSSCDGSVFLELADGAVPGGDFRVEWGSGRIADNVTSLTLDGLCAGANVITVTDDNGCVQTNIVNVPGPVPVEIDTNNSLIEDVTCNGNSDGRATLAAMGGTGPYTFFWPQQNISGPSVSNLSPGMVPVQITDSRGCVLDTFITITEPPVLTVSVDPNLISNIGCSGINDGQIGVQPSGGNPGAKQYTWSHGGSDGPIAAGLAPGTYTVTVTDVKGCTASISYTLSEPDPIAAIIPQPDEPACFGLQTFLTVSSATGGSGSGYTFSVDNGPLTPIGGTVPVLAGVRQVRVFDDKGCSYETTVTIQQPDQITIDLPELIEIDLGDTIALDPFVNSSLAITTYNWSNGTSLSCSNCLMPNAFPSNSTNYRFQVTDTNGCTATASIRIQVNKRRYVFIPDAFTPNGDGLNDIFAIYTGKGVEEIQFLRVYNRWGSLMYQQDSIAPEDSAMTGWDGQFNGEPMDMGVYIYTASIRFLDGTVLLYRGEVMLIR